MIACSHVSSGLLVNTVHTRHTKPPWLLRKPEFRSASAADVTAAVVALFTVAAWLLLESLGRVGLQSTNV